MRSAGEYGFEPASEPDLANAAAGAGTADGAALSAAPDGGLPDAATDEPGAGDAEPGGDDAAASPPLPAWQTSDGYVLNLPPQVLDRLILRGGSPGPRPVLRRSQLPAGRRRVPARRPPPGQRALLRRIGQLARSARRIGALRHRPSGRRFPVFRARSRGRSYQLVTRPRSRTRHEILLVRSVSPHPFEHREMERAARWLRWRIGNQLELPGESSVAEREFKLSDFPSSVVRLLGRRLEPAAVRLAIQLGHRNENTLSNLIFFARHPARKGRSLRKGEKDFTGLSAEWREIRDRIVRPILNRVETQEIDSAIAGGVRAENTLANRLFFKRYPERKGRALSRGERNFEPLSREWLDVRDRIVRPVLFRRFFAEYEKRFNPADPDFGAGMTAGDRTQRRTDVGQMTRLPGGAPGLLQVRFNQRRTEALRGRLPSFAAVTAAQRLIAQRLSNAQLDLFREFFPDGAGGIAFPAFQQAFEQFANGELREPSDPVNRPGFLEPDGAFYFLFAEFAFLCIELGISKNTWTKALRTFVKTQEIFMHVYRSAPVSPPPAVGASLPGAGSARPGRSFRFSNFKQIGSSIHVGEGQSTPARKKALRRKYDRMTVSALKGAARDNLLRALRMP